MKYTRKAFTMIELVFVIVVLGILSSIAISKMAVTRDDAIVAKGRSQVAAIRNAIILAKNKQMMEGNTTRADTLDSVSNQLFDKSANGIVLLDYPVYDKGADVDGNWNKTAANKYNFRVMQQNIPFTYTPADGKFDCNHGHATTGANCKLLTE